MHTDSLTSFINQLSTHTLLSDGEKAVLLGLPRKNEKLRTDSRAAKHEQAETACIVVSGLLARTADTESGSRQITSFYTPGDMPNFCALMRPGSAFCLSAACETELVRIPRAALIAAMKAYPAITEALTRELARHGDLAAQWVVNIGARPAKARIAHLMCEMAVRLGAVEKTGARFAFPVTQALLGQATGLSSVHVNRTIQGLRQDGIFGFDHGQVTIPDWRKFVNVAGFEGSYLMADEPSRLAN